MLSNLIRPKLSPSANTYISTVLVIIFGVALRVLPHPPNVAPVAAIALLGGAKLHPKLGLVLPLAIMAISDFVIGWHGTIMYTWGAFVLTGVLGHVALKRSAAPARLIAASLGASVLFFVVSNFGVWMEGWLYPRTLEGLVRAYTMAIPFFRNTLLGDLFFTGVLFSLYQIVHSTNKYIMDRMAMTPQNQR